MDQRKTLIAANWKMHKTMPRRLLLSNPCNGKLVPLKIVRWSLHLLTRP